MFEKSVTLPSKIDYFSDVIPYIIPVSLFLKIY